MNLKKELGSVADAVKKVMEAELSQKQKQIAKLAEPKNKIDASDLTKLRTSKAKGKNLGEESVEQIDETWKSLKKTKANLDAIRQTGKKVIVQHGEGDTIYRVLKQKKNVKNVKEEVEQIDELSKDTKARYIEAAARDLNRRGADAVGLISKFAKTKGKDEEDAALKQTVHHVSKSQKRIANVGKVARQLSREEVEEISEKVDPEQAKLQGNPSPSILQRVTSTIQDFRTMGKQQKLKQRLQDLSKLHRDEPKSENVKEETVKEQNVAENSKPSLFAQAKQGFKILGVRTHTGKHERSAESGVTDWDKENELAKKEFKPAKEKRKKYGARQNYVRSTRVNESFTDLLNVYKENGFKALENEFVKEEPTNDETKITAFDANEVNGVKIDTIEERVMTKPEMEKKEEIVKSMKKDRAGFKERYGDRAKDVMHATATKLAMKD